MPTTSRVIRAFLVLLAVLSHACASAAPDTSRRSDRSSADTKTEATAGAPAASSAAASPVIAMTSAQPAMMLADGEICEARAYFSERKQLNVYMMIDDSGSMIPWWVPTVDALNLFF
ncbi:MAG TPA: hypothetical protein VMF89_18155, partial [Polyangiales bacterium]|nr:hypothetical protein [Polyangiales bacterium]